MTYYLCTFNVLGILRFQTLQDYPRVMRTKWNLETDRAYVRCYRVDEYFDPNSADIELVSAFTREDFASGKPHEDTFFTYEKLLDYTRGFNDCFWPCVTQNNFKIGFICLSHIDASLFKLSCEFDVTIEDITSKVVM